MQVAILNLFYRFRSTVGLFTSKTLVKKLQGCREEQGMTKGKLTLGMLEKVIGNPTCQNIHTAKVYMGVMLLPSATNCQIKSPAKAGQ